MRREHPSQQGYEPFSFQDTNLFHHQPRRAINPDVKEEAAEDPQIALLTEIRDSLQQDRR
ncbi:hypothetical protein [Arthrobacter sp. FW306-06-A]|uniref:hypothetical protein n=1 Tax=Arthrobacter sp. FW306-06-A TaxID=2879621 RepID=UPI001F3D4B7C|nr:hypothetical protein [Arthrobacter sp. FW306-06-A]UKA71325.1 hypothetical protein LFT49_00780 [Arthrobacter sp. FW306-06-A]